MNQSTFSMKDLTLELINNPKYWIEFYYSSKQYLQFNLAVKDYAAET